MMSRATRCGAACYVGRVRERENAPDYASHLLSSAGLPLAPPLLAPPLHLRLDRRLLRQARLDLHPRHRLRQRCLDLRLPVGDVAAESTPLGRSGQLQPPLLKYKTVI